MECETEFDISLRDAERVYVNTIFEDGQSAPYSVVSRSAICQNKIPYPVANILNIRLMLLSLLSLILMSMRVEGFWASKNVHSVLTSETETK